MLTVVPLGLAVVCAQLVACVRAHWCWLLAAFIVPFNALGVIEYAHSGRVSFIQASTAVTCVLILRHLATTAQAIAQQRVPPWFWLPWAGLIAAVLLSWLCQWFANGTETMDIIAWNGPQSVSREWSSTQLVHLALLLHALLLMFTVAVLALDAKAAAWLQRGAVLGCAAAALWALLGLLAWKCGFTAFPFDLLNATTVDGSQSAGANLKAGRMAGPCLEPSHFVQFLAPVVLLLLIDRKPVWLGARLGTWCARGCLLVLPAAIAVANTTSGEVLLGVMVLAGLWSTLRAAPPTRQWWPTLWIAAMLVVNGALRMLPAHDGVMAATEWSRFMRWESIVRAWQVFGEHPWFGAGYCRVNAFSVAVMMLANVGVVGAALWLMATLQPFAVAWAALRRASGLSTETQALLWVVATLLVLQVLAGTWTLACWFWGGLLIAALLRTNTEPSHV